jgi:hypothetical protein
MGDGDWNQGERTLCAISFHKRGAATILITAVAVGDTDAHSRKHGRKRRSKADIGTLARRPGAAKNCLDESEDRSLSIRRCRRVIADRQHSRHCALRWQFWRARLSPANRVGSNTAGPISLKSKYPLSLCCNPSLRHWQRYLHTDKRAIT